MVQKDESLTDEERYETTFHYFIKALRLMAADANTQCELMGNFNVAWELQHDVTDNGTALLDLPASHLTETQKEEIRKFIGKVNEIPASVLAAASSSVANTVAMSDPSWIPLRDGASRLILTLERREDQGPSVHKERP
jgi:hypothetical protein